MSKNLLNEGYEKNTELFYKGDKEKIFSKKKSYLDLSMCAGSILLGHKCELAFYTCKFSWSIFNFGSISCKQYQWSNSISYRIG